MSNADRAQLIETVTELTRMLGGVLQIVNRVLDACEDGPALTPAELDQLRHHSVLWAEEIRRLRQILTSLEEETPPERLH